MNIEKMKQVVFITVIFLLLLSLISIVFAANTVMANLWWLLPVALVAIILFFFDFVIQVEEHEKAVIMRMGKLNRVRGPGWVVMIPFFETPKLVDLRIQTIDIPPQDVITKGKIELKIDAIVFMKVGDDDQSVINSLVKIDNYKKATENFVGAAIRDVIGGMSLDDLISNVESMNEELRKQLIGVSKNWGVAIDKVEIRDINIPKEVLDAMHAQKAAEQHKLARMEEATAHKAEIEAVQEAASSLSDKAIAYYAIKAFEKLGEGKSTKFIIPAEVMKFASFLTTKLGGDASSKPAKKMDPEKFVMKNKDLLMANFDPKLVQNLLDVIKEEKKKSED